MSIINERLINALLKNENSNSGDIRKLKNLKIKLCIEYPVSSRIRNPYKLSNMVNVTVLEVEVGNMNPSALDIITDMYESAVQERNNKALLDLKRKKEELQNSLRYR